MTISKTKILPFLGAILLSTSAVAVPPPQNAALDVCAPKSGTIIRLVCKVPSGFYTIKSGPDESAGITYQDLKTAAGTQKTLACNILADGYNQTQPVTNVDGGSMMFDITTPNVIVIKNPQFKPITGKFTDFDGSPVTGYFQFLPPPIYNAISYTDSTCPPKKS